MSQDNSPESPWSPLDPFAPNAWEEGPEAPGATLWTGLANDTADAAERQAWEEIRQDAEGAMEELEHWRQRSAQVDPHEDLDALLARGMQLRKELSPLRQFLEQQPAQKPAPQPEARPAPWWELSWLWPVMAPVGAAAALALWWIASPVAPSPRPHPPKAPAPTGYIGVKSDGHMRFSLFYRRKGTIKEVKGRFRGQVGDQLRFVYSYGPKGSRCLYLSLFSIDRKKQMSLLYPAKKGGKFALCPGDMKYLPDGVTVETMTAPERIFACISKRPLGYEQLTQARDKARAPLARLQRLALPCTYQKSWLLLENAKGGQP